MHFQGTVPYQLHRNKNQDDKDEDEGPVKSWRYVRLFFHL
jgi:hypothetical protein